MIPQRIRLLGFLSYKDEQEIDFGSAALWMLAGNNGSGKSAIFDALTYALFGAHRGGSTNHVELINKESNAATVEFDFRLDHVSYRIRRTLRRSTKGSATGTQQLSTIHTDGSVEPIPDTSRKADFDAWIDAHIGLNYETFTSSVLLLQGKAEKLLDAKPSGRAAVLAGIVNLERYEKLHARANDRKLECKNRLEALSHQLAGIADVTDLEYATALLAVEAGDDDRRQVLQQIEDLVTLELAATRRLDAVNRLAGANKRLAAANTILHDAGRIETDDRRRQELAGVLPAAHTVVTMRADATASQTKAEKFIKEREATQVRTTAADVEVVRLKKQRDELLTRQTTEEARLQALGTRLRELSTLLEKVRQGDEAEAEVARLTAELSAHPASLEAEFTETTRTLERLEHLRGDLVHLERIGSERQELIEAQELEAKQKSELATVTERGKQRKTALAEAEPVAAQAVTERNAAAERLAVARSRFDAATLASQEVEHLAGKPTCTACGQTLTAAHLAEERAKRDAELRRASVERTQSEEALARAANASDAATQQLATLTKQRDAAREQYLKFKNLVADSGRTTTRLREALSLRYDELSQPESHKIAATQPADWATTIYPASADLVRLRREAETWDAVRRRQKQQQESLTKVAMLRAKHEGAEAGLARLRAGLAGLDPAAIRTEHHGATTEESSLAASVKSIRHSLVPVVRALETRTAEGHDCVQKLSDLQGKLNTEEMNRKHCREAGDRALAQLPPAWQTLVKDSHTAEYSAWSTEYQRLLADGVEAKAKSLTQARINQEALRDDIRLQERELAKFPPEADVSPDEIKLRIAAARNLADEKDDALLDARKAKADLDSLRSQRGKLTTEATRIDGEFHRWKIVAELLGRDRLQRFLVRQAERQIVEYGNAVLDRLSGGQLFLKLVGGDEGTGVDKALDLEATNRIAGTAPINVSFLSGSQKFRVAVSLALAIGQYAGRQQRPIESVIIDEGFGCLDRQGRQIMIQELQNLRGHLHCILLVSHQEEFADAFPDGYRFELEDGTTRVKRFQR